MNCSSFKVLSSMDFTSAHNAVHQVHQYVHEIFYQTNGKERKSLDFFFAQEHSREPIFDE